MKTSRIKAKQSRTVSIFPKPAVTVLDTIKQGSVYFDIVRGNYQSAAQLAVEKLATPTTKAVSSGMAPRRKMKFKRRQRRRPRRVIPSLRPTTLHIRHIVPYSATNGSQHRWYYTVAKNWLVSSFLKTFDEFKISSILVKYVPNNSTNETGLYSGVLLDRGGFGSYGAATAAQWFTTIGAMPGSKIRPRFVSSAYRWRPTEPSVRDWVATDKNINYCTVYVCNNGKETDELGGLFEVSAVVQARGLYYNAAVKMYHEEKRNHLVPPDDIEDHDSQLATRFVTIGIEGDETLPSDDLY